MKVEKEEMTMNDFALEYVTCRDDKLILKQLINLYPSRFKLGTQTVLKRKQLEDILNHYMRDGSRRKLTLKLDRYIEKTKDKIKGTGKIINIPGGKRENYLPPLDMEVI